MNSISVVIATIGRKSLPGLLHAIEGDLEGLDFEIIVVKDGPQEFEIKEHDFPNILFIKLIERNGPGTAFKEGVKASSKKYIRIFPDDDIWVNNFIVENLEFCLPNTILVGELKLHDEMGNCLRKVSKKVNVNGPIVQLYKLPNIFGRNGTFLALSAMIFNRENLIKVNFEEGKKSKEDVILLQKMWLAGIKFVFTAKPAVYGKTSLIRSSIRTNLKEEIEFLEALLVLEPEMVSNYVYRNLARPHLITGRLDWLRTIHQINKIHRIAPNLVDLFYVTAYIIATPIVFLASKRKALWKPFRQVSALQYDNKD